MPATPSTGPKQPLQGIFILMHDSPHPLRVAGPAQRISWARNTSRDPLPPDVPSSIPISSLSGFVRFLLHISQSEVLGAREVPLGGRSPVIRPGHGRTRSGGGGAAGQVVIDIDHVVQRVDLGVEFGQGQIIAILFGDWLRDVASGLTTVGESL